MLLSSRLRNFKTKSSGVYNFSCPYCGDSKKISSKARGYVYYDKGKQIFHCHNCGKHTEVRYLIKDIDPVLYQDYLKEYLIGNKKVEPKDNFEQFRQKTVFKKNMLRGLKKISSLANDDPVKQYVLGRMIPSEFHHMLYLCDGFKKWVNGIIPDKFDTIENDEPRLVIPFLNAGGELFGFQGRSFKPDSKVKYITIILDEDSPKLFGLDRVDLMNPVIVVEGPLDAMFLRNCIASAGGSIISALPHINKDTTKFIVVYDNEPRSKDTIKKMQSAINAGYDVCVWPDSIEQNDVNAMVLTGMKPLDIEKTIKQNSYHGLEAQLKLQQWKKI